MLFNSFSFLIFLTVVLVVARSRWSWTGRKITLLVSSYLFYATWNPPFVVLLWLSTCVDWFVARAIHRSGSPAARRVLLAVSLSVNLGLLAAFKYADFLLGAVAAAAEPLGITFAPADLGIILPVGISFYTFQTLSYTIDVYRRRLVPSDSFLDYALFVTFFPQLVAGPIVRAADFLPQCRESNIKGGGQLSWGMILFVYGLCLKVVIADGLLAPIADRVFGSSQAVGAVGAWAGVFAFAGQILCDFEGYSLCAIGIAGCLGFTFRDNFRFPYAAVGFSDFWRRWHISLSSWLRDYLYIPLGGNRGGRWRTTHNLMITMLLGGLWHGASWRFVAWGGLHGGFLVAERALTRRFGHWPVWRTAFARFGLALVTFALVCLAWVPFRAPSFAAAWQLYLQLFGFVTGPGLKPALVATSFVVCVIIVAVSWFARDRTLAELWGGLPGRAQVALLTVIILTTLHYMIQGDELAFIYFQF